MENLKKTGVKRKVVALEMLDRGIPRQDYDVCDENDNVIGKICSGTQSPSLNKAIATALVDANFSKIDTEIFVKIREKLLKAKVVRLPFLKIEN
jgi:aminomethyltransferase